MRGLKKKPSPWLEDVSVYDTFVLWHRDAFGCALMAAHMGPAYFPWHRLFLLLFDEKQEHPRNPPGTAERQARRLTALLT